MLPSLFSFSSRNLPYHECSRFSLRGQLHRPEDTSPPPFPGTNFFFPRKIGKHKQFLHVNNMWDYSLFIEQDLSDKKVVSSF